MKKLYTIALAAAVALSATAAGQMKQIKSWSELASPNEVREFAVANKKLPEGAVLKKVEKKAPVKAPAIAELEGTWEVSYRGLLNSNSGNHQETATFTWDARYDQFEITIEGCTVAPFYAYYDESTGMFTFAREQYDTQIYGGPISASTYRISNSYSAQFDEETQSFSIDYPMGLGIALFPSLLQQAQGYYWFATDLVFTKPDGDYGVNLVIESEECVHELGKVNFGAITGSDITKVELVIWTGDMDIATLDDYGMWDRFAQEIQPNAGYSFDLSLEDGEVAPDEDDYITFMVKGYNAEGLVKRRVQKGLFLQYNRDDQYQTIGTIPFNDVLVNGYYNNFSNDKEAVEIQENIAVPGKYRIVDAYAGQDALHDQTATHYIYLDAQDPDFVNIGMSNTGLDFGDGLLVMGTFGGALGYSKEQCAERGYTVGSLDERTITFPTKTVLAHEQYYNGAGSWSYMNGTDVVIELPALVLNVTVLDADNANQPMSGINVEAEGVKATTDAEGKATLSLPASVDYLATVQLTATNAEETDKTTTREVKLNGANNDYELMASGLTGVNDLLGDKTEAEVEYFNLQGVRVENPAAGQLVIKKEGNNVSKVLVK